MSETAVQLHQAKEPAVVLTKEDIRRYICPTADDKEIFMFLGICKSFGLNPLKREVHLIKYGNSPASIVTGYEVYLKRAERTNKLNGWKVEVAKDGTSATVTIHRKDWNQPFEWTAYRQEFDKGQANWKTMPLFMLRKVAMAQAFRICFPDEMGGLPYLPEEISGNISEALPAGNVDTAQEPAAAPPQVPQAAAPGVDAKQPPVAPQPEGEPTISQGQGKLLYALAMGKKMSKEILAINFKSWYGCDLFKLPKSKFEEAKKRLEGLPEQGQLTGEDQDIPF